MQKPAMMYCCLARNRAGQLRRSLALASKLSEAFDVALLLDAELAESIDIPAHVKVFTLPSIGGDALGSNQLRQRLVKRRDLMLRAFARLQPRIVAVEDFPFSHQALLGEVLPLIERARSGLYGEAVVACITDGLLGQPWAERGRQQERAAELLDRFFDLVIVRSDPLFARLEEFFRPRNGLSIPVHHVGFVAAEEPPATRLEPLPAGTMLVSAGAGGCGMTLFRAAAEAFGIIGSTPPLPMTMVAGDRLPAADWRELQWLADGRPGLTVVRSVPDLGQAMAQARWSLSQCDYTTAVSAIQARTPSLFVPCNGVVFEEQRARAQRLADWGAGRLLLPHLLNGASLANEILELMRFRSRSLPFELNGAANAAHLLTHAAYGNQSAPLAPETAIRDRGRHWP